MEHCRSRDGKRGRQNGGTQISAEDDGIEDGIRQRLKRWARHDEATMMEPWSPLMETMTSLCWRGVDAPPTCQDVIAVLPRVEPLQTNETLKVTK